MYEIRTLLVAFVEVIMERDILRACWKGGFGPGMVPITSLKIDELTIIKAIGVRVTIMIMMIGAVGLGIRAMVSSNPSYGGVYASIKELMIR